MKSCQSVLISKFMIYTKIIIFLISIIFICHMPAYAINPEKNLKDTSILLPPENWFNMDFENDHYFGVSTERAYEPVKEKKSKRIVVAILDSGVDLFHEDLKDHIWINVDEIPDNGIDDDQNGYIDDIHGWNFIGGKIGTPVEFDTYEVTRLYALYKSKFDHVDTTNLSSENLKEFEKYRAIKTDFENLKKRNESNLNALNSISKRYNNAAKIIASYLCTDSIDSVSLEQLKNINSDVDSIDLSAELLIKLKKKNFDNKKLQNTIEKINNNLIYSLNTDYDPRYIVGDNYDKPDDRDYGNKFVKGPESTHGTHVSGIVAADRNNTIGIKGIANNVEIMIVRVVPDGDERDKDVANAILYAVENGAEIINMSFGKGYSPNKDYVDKAVEIAEKNNVLIVHAAGNDSENNDKVPNYPSRIYNSGRICKPWIEVGAITWKNDTNMIAGFSNYGRKNVDLFAPGFDIYSTIPEQGYNYANGTSMASPMVTGVAALVWSYYPELTALEIKEIILKSAVKYKNKKVMLPGNPDKMVKFKKLSKTGGVVNAYYALKLAEKKYK